MKFNVYYVDPVLGGDGTGRGRDGDGTGTGRDGTGRGRDGRGVVAWLRGLGLGG